MSGFAKFIATASILLAGATSASAQQSTVRNSNANLSSVSSGQLRSVQPYSAEEKLLADRLSRPNTI